MYANLGLLSTASTCYQDEKKASMGAKEVL